MQQIEAVDIDDCVAVLDHALPAGPPERLQMRQHGPKLLESSQRVHLPRVLDGISQPTHVTIDSEPEPCSHLLLALPSHSRSFVDFGTFLS